MSLGLVLILTIALLGITSPVEAQVSPNVPIGDPVYDYVERLADLGLAPGYMRGTRPISVAYAVRLVREAAAIAARARRPEPSFMDTLRDLIERWRPHDLGPVRLGGEAVVAATTRDEVLALQEDRQSTGLGHLESTAGGPLGRASGAWLGVTGQASAGRWLAAEVSGRVGFPAAGATAALARGYAKVGWGALELEFGRDDVVWGQGRHAGMTLSGNAPPIDQLTLRTARPIRLPWVFRYLGDVQVAVFVARLDQTLPHDGPYLVGKRIALKPTRWLEVGLIHLFSFGGTGAPSYSAGRFAEEFFFGYRQDVWGINYANNAFAWDLRLDVKGWFEIYGEHYLEDCCARPFTRDSSLLVGVRRPRFASPRDDLALEFAATSFFAYVPSGTPEWAQGGLITGHPLGNRGFGAYALWRYLGDRGEVLRLRLAFERRNAPDPRATPAEYRAGVHLDLRLPLLGGRAGRVDGRARLALERVNNVAHVANADRTAGLAELAVEVSF